METHIFDQIIKRRDNRQCRKNDRRLRQSVEQHAEKIQKPISDWEQRDIFDYVHLWDKDFKLRPNTVRMRFDNLVKVCPEAIWAKAAQENRTSFQELVNLYMRIRAENSQSIRVTAQAPEISLDTARAVAGHLLATNKSTVWEQQLCHVRLLALSFSFVGGCRVGDLQHIKWGKIFEGTLEGSPAIYAVLDWSKTNPYGLKDDDYRIFPAFTHKVLCPVELWRLLEDSMPKENTPGPFYSIRNGVAFKTDVIVRGWKSVAESLRLSTDFSAHSCRRSRITRMRDLGLSDFSIKRILGYSDKSQMPAHYDIKKRVGNKAAIDKEIKSYILKIKSR